MAIFDNLTKAAKDFFVEDEEPAAAVPTPPAPANSPALPPSSAPTAGQPEQRHLDHIAGLLATDGKDFGAFTKLLKSMAGSGMSGPLLYQTAFNAFAALTGADLPTLLSSADAQVQKLATDRAMIEQRHREKLGDAPATKGPPSALVDLLHHETQLQAAVADLTKQLAEKTQLLQNTQQQLQAERQKAQAALASYEMANAAAVAELQAHRQATQSFLTAGAKP